MRGWNRLAAAALLGVGWPAAGSAAQMNVRMLIECTFDEAVALTSVGSYEGTAKADVINSWFGGWLLSGEARSPDSRLTFHWNPSSASGPVLEIAADNTVHNLVRLLSRTDDSLIAVTSASDPLTAESWLFTLNFARETVIATQVQTNIAGVKGQVLRYSCKFGY